VLSLRLGSPARDEAIRLLVVFADRGRSSRRTRKSYSFQRWAEWPIGTAYLALLGSRQSGVAGRFKVAATLAAGLAVVSAAAVGSFGGDAGDARAAEQLTPGLFSKISSGVALIRTYGCQGKPIAEGSGFLVGETVVMTARHVVEGACKVRVSVSGERLWGQRWVFWVKRSGQGNPDVATIKLARPSHGYVFMFREAGAPAGANLAALGHPLGSRISLNQGKIIRLLTVDGIPVMVVDMLGAEGGSGSPFVDDQGRVVGVVQIGLGGKDILGQRTSGVIAGIDLARAWGRRAGSLLCRAYPRGGIPSCSRATAPSSPAAGGGGNAPLTLSDAMKLGSRILLTEGELPGGTWSLKSFGPAELSCGNARSLMAFLGCSSCATSNAQSSFLFGRERLFASRVSGDRFFHEVIVLGTPDAASVVFRRASSPESLRCFGELMRSAVGQSLRPSEVVNHFWYGHTTSPRMGEGHYASYAKWEVIEEPSGQIWDAVLYNLNVRSGNTFQRFDLLAFDTAKLFPTFLRPITDAVNRAHG